MKVNSIKLRVQALLFIILPTMNYKNIEVETLNIYLLNLKTLFWSVNHQMNGIGGAVYLSRIYSVYKKNYYQT